MSEPQFHDLVMAVGGRIESRLMRLIGLMPLGKPHWKLLRGERFPRFVPEREWTSCGPQLDGFCHPKGERKLPAPSQCFTTYCQKSFSFDFQASSQV